MPNKSTLNSLKIVHEEFDETKIIAEGTTPKGGV